MDFFEERNFIKQKILETINVDSQNGSFLRINIKCYLLLMNPIFFLFAPKLIFIFLCF